MLTNSGLIYIVSKSANGKSTLTLASLGKGITIDKKTFIGLPGGGGVSTHPLSKYNRQVS
jgi:hypothetical protein